jgi:hypothetical protein
MDAYLAIPEVVLEWVVEPGSPTDGFDIEQRDEPD